MKMVNINKIVYMLLLLAGNKVKSKEIQCPAICKCDMFETYRQATCTNRNLISVEADIPPQVELLDLSYNVIIKLHDHTFVDLHLTSMKLLNLSHNKLSQIEMNAFSDLNQIKTIDLSYNNIEYLLVNWFWNLPKLQELYLQGNNLRKFNEEPVLESKSIRVLDFSGCSLLHIHEDAFAKLPNLEILDLSKNMLIRLNINVLKHIPNLQILELQNNAWLCNDMRTLINYCKDKGIKCNDVCVKQTTTIKEEKFQRMIAEPSPDIEKAKNSWMYEQEFDTQNITVQPCPKPKIINKKYNLLVEVLLLSPVLSLVVPFIIGVCVGVIITMKPIKKKQKLQQTRRSNIRDSTLYEYPLIQQESYEGPDSTPMPLRKIISAQPADLI